MLTGLRSIHGMISVHWLETRVCCAAKGKDCNDEFCFVGGDGAKCTSENAMRATGDTGVDDAKGCRVPMARSGMNCYDALH